MTVSEIDADDQMGTNTRPVLALESVSKRFATVQALNDVTLDCRPGEIHAVLGENGSGKSTLFGIASGVLTPDRGRVVIAGTDLDGGPGRARDRGLAIAYQTYSLVPDLSVAHNLMLSVPPALCPGRLADAVEWAGSELDRLGVTFDPRAVVSELSLARRQLLEVVKALVARPKVLLLDEPTTALAPREVSTVHELVAAEVAGGLGVLYVSHRLPEILPIADRVTVLRDGRCFGTFDAAAVTEDDVVAAMIGRPVELAFPPRRDPLGDSTPRLRVERLSGDRFGPVDFEVRPGEIVGIAGAEGNGQGNLLRAIAGVEQARSGTVTVDGRSAKVTSPSGALAHRVMLLSGERLRESLFPVLGVRPNITVGILRRFSRLGLVNSRREHEAASGLVRELKVRTPSTEQPVRFLSGGNQQKVVLARPFLDDVAVLLAEEPTQGVDVGSRFEIYEALRRHSSAGMSVVIRSADAIELAGLCDRVLVVSRGQIVGELSGDELTEDRIIAGIVRAQANGLGDPDSPIAAERSASAPAATRPPPRRRDPLTARPWFPLVALATLSLLVGIYAWQRSAAFLTEFNLNSLLLLTVPLALASMGQTHVLLLGQFDISVGAVMGLTVVCGSFVLSSDSLPRLLLGVAALVAIAGAVGVLNVSLTRGLTIPSVVATIATLSVVRGITLILRPTPSGLISFSLSDALTAGWGFVPYSFVGVVVLAVGLDLRLYRSRAGVRTRALGFDESASARLGVPRGVQYIRAFILASVFACAGGIFLAALVGVGDPRLGTSFTLPTLAAAVLGGAALTGGRGSFLGAVNGALFLTLVINVLPFLGWSAAWGDVARGVVTVAALAAFRGSDLLELIRSRRFKRSPTPD